MEYIQFFVGTAVVAYTISENERLVKHVKHSWLIVHGVAGQAFSLEWFLISGLYGGSDEFYILSSPLNS